MSNIAQNTEPIAQNTAIYIVGYSENEKQKERLKKLIDSVKKNTNLQIFYHSKVTGESIKQYKENGVIASIENTEFPLTIKNIAPIDIATIGDVNGFFKWLILANKSTKTVVVANNLPNAKASIIEKWSGYWSNFWSKLFTGTNTNLAHSEWVLINNEAYNKINISNAWQIAAIAEKENSAELLNNELPVKSHTIGSGFISFFTGFGKGFKTIVNSFFKAKTFISKPTNWLDINHSGYKKIFGFSATILLALMAFISFDYNVTWDEPNHNNYSADVLDYYTTLGEDTSLFCLQAEGHTDNKSNIYYGMSIDVVSRAVNRLLGFEQKMQPKDIISITLSSSSNITDTFYNSNSKRFAVDENGFITQKAVGKLNVKNKTLSEIKQLIKQKLKEKSIEATPNVAIYSYKQGKQEFSVRHFLNALVGFLAILFTALIVRRLSGWLPAIIALLAMVCSPSFFGHCFNNPKDIPFAAGYIMAVYYIIKLLLELPKAKTQTKAMLALSIGFAISIRVQGVLPILFLIAFVGLYWLFNHLNSKNKQVLHYIKMIFGISIVAYIIGIILWPYALRNPFSGPFTALKEFEKFGFLTYYELFEGVRIYQKPWYYEPKLIMLTAPLAIIGGFILGLLLGWFKKDKRKLLAVALLVFATLFPSGYAIYKKSYVYNGWRHFIFIYPSLVAIAVLGWYWLAQWFKNTKIVTIVMAIIALSFVKPAIWSIANHPYQYMYFNEIAGGIKGANGLYEIDYWNQSPRAAFDWLVKNKPEILKGDVRVSSNNIQEALKTFVPEGKDAMYKWTREYEWANDDWKYAIWTTRTLSKNQILGGNWPPKGTIHEIKVDGVTVAAVVKSENNYSHLANQYLKKNNIDTAIYLYEKALNYNPLEEEYVRGLANAYKAAKNYDKALIYYNKALVLRDGNYEAYAGLGECYYYQAFSDTTKPEPIKQLLEKAKDNLEKAVYYKKNFSGVFNMLAVTHGYLGNKEEALSNYANFFEYQATQETYNQFSEMLKQSGMSGEEAEPYYYLYNKALTEGEKAKADNFLLLHEQMMGGK